MFEAFLWMFSSAWVALKVALEVGIICPLVVMDPTI